MFLRISKRAEKHLAAENCDYHIIHMPNLDKIETIPYVMA